jgi:hypothetical protein
MCLTLFSGAGSEGYEVGVQANYGMYYMKAQSLAGEVPLTQGIELRHDNLTIQYGFGSLVQRGEYNDTWGDMFTEAAIKYTWGNGIYAKLSSVSGTSNISAGLSVKWGE